MDHKEYIQSANPPVINKIIFQSSSSCPNLSFKAMKENQNTKLETINLMKELQRPTLLKQAILPFLILAGCQLHHQHSAHNLFSPPSWLLNFPFIET